MHNVTRLGGIEPSVEFCMGAAGPGGPLRSTPRSGTYFTADDMNATSAWICDGLSVLLNVFGMIPEA